MQLMEKTSLIIVYEVNNVNAVITDVNNQHVENMVSSQLSYGFKITGSNNILALKRIKKCVSLQYI